MKEQETQARTPRRKYQIPYKHHPPTPTNLTKLQPLRPALLKRLREPVMVKITLQMPVRLAQRLLVAQITAIDLPPIILELHEAETIPPDLPKVLLPRDGVLEGWVWRGNDDERG